MHRMPDIGLVIEDLAEYLQSTPARLRLLQTRVRDDESSTVVRVMAEQMGLSVPREVSVLDFALCAELSKELKDALEEHREHWADADYPAKMFTGIRDWFRDSQYPKQIADWILRREHPEPLGRYFSASRHIELYWLHIALLANAKTWSARDLSLVVLVHEWAHAFTHRGRGVFYEAIPLFPKKRDISNDADWKTTYGESILKYWFNRLSKNVCEGVAQYWTHYVLRSRPEWKAPFSCYAELAENQFAEYKVHVDWIPKSHFRGTQLENMNNRVKCLPSKYDLREGMRRGMLDILRDADHVCRPPKESVSQDQDAVLSALDRTMLAEVTKWKHRVNRQCNDLIESTF